MRILSSFQRRNSSGGCSGCYNAQVDIKFSFVYRVQSQQKSDLLKNLAILSPDISFA